VSDAQMSGVHRSQADGPRVLLCARPGTGGSARVIEALLRRLPEHGIGGTAALSSTEGTDLLDAAATHGWTVERVDMRREIAPLADLGALRRLRRLGDGHDLVHAHAAKAGALARVALGGRLPVIYSPHGFYFTYHEPGSPKYRRYLAFEKRLAGRTASLHCVSSAEAQTAVEHELAPLPFGPHLIYNPVPPACRVSVAHSRDRWGALKVPMDAPLVVMIARLAEPKDPLTFIRAAAHVPTELGARFVLVGDGPLLDSARAEAEGHENVHLLGHVPDAGALLAGADVAVLTSASEGLPLTLVEAVAVGIPVVASDLPGGREASGPGGRYVPRSSPTALAHEITRFLTDSAHRDAHAAAGRRHAAQFDEDTWIARMVALYRMIAD